MPHWTRTSRAVLIVVTGCLGSLATTLLAQTNPNPSQPGTARVPRPQSTSGAAVDQPAGNANAQRDAAELDRLLTAWEAQSSQVKSLEGQFRLYTYDSVFSLETRADGQFFYQNPDKARMDFQPSDTSQCSKNAAGKPTNSKDNNIYEVLGHPEERWNCDGETIRTFDLKERTYREMKIPENYRGDSIKDSPLPFLFGMRKAEAQQRYILGLGKFHNRVLPKISSKPVIHVTAIPLREQDATEWSEAEVILDRDTFLPCSIRTKDPAKTRESVYVFSETVSNRAFHWKDPFSISTRGFTRLQSQEATVPAGLNESPLPKGQTPFDIDARRTNPGR